MPRFTLLLLALGSLVLFGSTVAAAKPTLAELTKRAEQGNAKAQYTLGVMYDDGDGVLKDSAEAVKWYRMAAEQGYAKAQASLGYMYTVGEGVPKDSAEAVKWYRMAAEQGNATAQYNLGIKYATGDGVPKDSFEAAIWYREAADQGKGHAKARYNLGVMYATGEGVPKDSEEAEKWYRKAAELNYAKAQTNLGYMYATGDGVSRDSAEAVKWYRKAAEQGDATAQYNLGVMSAAGDGVPKDLVQAHVWLNIAGSQGGKDVRPNLAGIEHDMTAEQKAEAKKLALPAIAAESRIRTSGWYASFRPAKGARIDFLPDGGGFKESEENASCRYGIWVPLTGPDAEIEISSDSEGSDAAKTESKPETFQAIVLQRSEEMVVLKLVMKGPKHADCVQIYTVFPKIGVGFLSTSSANALGKVDARDHAAASQDIPRASGSVTPLTRVD